MEMSDGLFVVARLVSRFAGLTAKGLLVRSGYLHSHT